MSGTVSTRRALRVCAGRNQSHRGGRPALSHDQMATGQTRRPTIRSKPTTLRDEAANPLQDAIGRSRPFERVSATVGLRFRETGFSGAETMASKRPVTFIRSSAETKRPHETPPIRRLLHDTGKSLFVGDCVGGLELPTKRLSVACSEH
jgi:hypothetical protein